MSEEKAPEDKIQIGWFSFSCCEDNTIVMTEVMNDHWQEWKRLFNFKHAKVLQTKNEMGHFDVAFIEGAIASKEHEEKVKEIRSLATKLVTVGSCAVTGLPAGQRNNFNEKQHCETDHLVEKFDGLPKVKKVSEVVDVDVEIPGCPMNPDTFLEKVNALVAELQGSQK